MKTTKPSISIFFPFLNDWGTVGSLLGLSVATVSKLTDDWEIIIVNDGSKKEDREALGMIVKTINNQKSLKTPGRWLAYKDSFQVEESKIKIIDHEKNRGYGGALRTGFASCKKDLIFYTDCDAQYDPRELTKLYKALNKDIGMVNGFKIKRNDPWYRTVTGRIYHHVVQIAFSLPISDTDCDFRLVRREVFAPSASSGRTAVRLFENTGTICIELVKKIDHAGYKIKEVPVHHFWRTSGKSQYFNFRRLFYTFINLFKLWWKLIVKGEYY